MKLRSPTDTPVHVSLTSGHTMLIGPEPIEVENRFMRKALNLGCLREGEQPEQAEARAEKTKHDLIVAGIQLMMAGDEPADFNNDGTPDLRRLSKRVGFDVSRDERDAAWKSIADDQSDDPDA